MARWVCRARLEEEIVAGSVREAVFEAIRVFRRLLSWEGFTLVECRRVDDS